MKNALVLQNVNVTLPNQHRLYNINLSIEKGTAMGLIGRTDSGKTALIKTIMNLIRRDSGQILYDGMDFYENEIDVKKKVGCIFDTLPFPLSSKPKKIVKTISSFYDSFNTTLYENYMEQFQLNPNTKLLNYSDASLKKFYCIVILACNPDILLLDEPIDFTDSKDVQDILGLLNDFMKDGSKSMLYATSSPVYLESLLDSIALLHNGHILPPMSINELLDSYVLVTLPTRALFQELQSKLLFVTETPDTYKGLLLRSDLPIDLELGFSSLTTDTLTNHLIELMQGGTIYEAI